MVFFRPEKKIDGIYDHILVLLNIKECLETIDTDLRKKCSLFDLTIRRLWKASSRNQTLFKKRHQVWLKSEFNIPESVKNSVEHSSTGDISRHSRGRLQKSFQESSEKTKKRRVESLVHLWQPEELNYAATISARSFATNKNKSENLLSPPKALALYLDLDLSERKYDLLRATVNAVHKDCYPSLYALKQFKKQFLPVNTKITETTAGVDLQEILNKTAESIVTLVDIDQSTTTTLVCKWGFDGSSGHSAYKQIFVDSDNTAEFLFLIALCPLKLVNDNTGKELWKNPHPSSTLYCRPLKFTFIKENATLIINEENAMNELINKLKNYCTSKNGCNINISYKMLLTMIDGSVTNILSGTKAASKCYICGATPKEMNKENVHNRTPKQNYRFGISSLHAWIRSFECLLHIAYRLPLKTWQVRGASNKTIFQNRKKHIQTSFKERMGLIVDKPKPGFGSTNDGNTARRFFANPKVTSEITGIDEKLIENFSIILRVIASGKKIYLPKFKEILRETKDLYIQLYGWYYMPSSVHKLLIHGIDIISNFDLPIGQLSEEALEASHKEFRKHRLAHTRKSSRINTNKDLLNLLLLRSDPLISQSRNPASKKSKTRDTDIQSYIITESDNSCSSSDLTCPAIKIESDEEMSS